MEMQFDGIMSGLFGGIVFLIALLLIMWFMAILIFFMVTEFAIWIKELITKRTLKKRG